MGRAGRDEGEEAMGRGGRGDERTKEDGREERGLSGTTDWAETST